MHLVASWLLKQRLTIASIQSGSYMMSKAVCISSRGMQAAAFYEAALYRQSDVLRSNQLTRPALHSSGRVCQRQLSRGQGFSCCHLLSQGSFGSHHPFSTDCRTAAQFGNSTRELHRAATAWRIGATPHQAGSNLVIGPEPILKEQAPARADSSSWTPDEEWDDMLQARQGRLLLVDGMAVAYRAYFKIGVSALPNMYNDSRKLSIDSNAVNVFSLLFFSSVVLLPVSPLLRPLIL